ncbi:MAG TPA: hypothetical protein VGM51_05865 [Armatimonadota bacterium]
MPGTAFVATSTTNGLPVPYGAFGLFTYLSNQFVEISVDVTQLVKAVVNPCSGINIKTVFVKTKTSTASNAVLEDLVDPIPVSFSAGFTVSAIGTNPKCNGGTDGSITATATGGSGTLSYSINGGANYLSSNVFNGLAAGTYTVTVKDSGGCVITSGPVTLVNPPALVASSLAGTISCNGGTTTVTVGATGGTPPYLGTGSFTVSSGPYSFTVTDAHGCSSTTTGTVSQPPALSASITAQTNVACFGDKTGSVTVAGAGGTSPYSYSIDGTNFGASGTFSGLAAGSYTVTVKDANGCTTTQAVTITQPAAALSASITAQTNVACFGDKTGSVTVAGTGGTSPYSYSIDGTNFGASGTFSGLAAGSYTITVKDANGCTTTQAVTITQPAAALSASITAQTNVACFGDKSGSVTVAGAGGTIPYSYSIDGTNFGASGTFSGLAAGSYTVTVKDANGCTTTQAVTITQPNSALSASAKSTDVGCAPVSAGSVTVTVSGGTAPYAVVVNSVTKNITTSGGSATFGTLPAGTYTATVTDANGCKTTATATVNPSNCVPMAIVTDSSLCTYDVDPSTPCKDFRLLFTQDPKNKGCYKLTASNPGQTYFNVFGSGTPGDTLTFVLTIPYPFVTQGANPIHAYDGVTITPTSTGECLTPGNGIPIKSVTPSPIITLNSYSPKAMGSSVTLTAQVVVPASGFVYLNIHLDYGLKGMGGYSPDLSSNALQCGTSTVVPIPNGDHYLFGLSGDVTGSDQICNINQFSGGTSVGLTPTTGAY